MTTEYYIEHKEIIKENAKQRYHNNKELRKKQIKAWNKTYNGKRAGRVKMWKKYGIVDPCLNDLYDYLVTQTHCWICLKKYKNSQERQLDHDHETGEPRYICCRACNSGLLRNPESTVAIA